VNREKVAFTVMKPVDLALGAAIQTLKSTGSLNKLTDQFYALAKKMLRGQFEKNNDLRGEGTEKVPLEGGAIFASNHQSWSDVQVIGATCPRRLRFMAKSEFETWPILRHMIALSDSPYIRRGGDKEGMEMAVETLKEGKALVIFPEGTIPGEENLMRHDVEPDTGLLRGHSGAVRLAIFAKVPIIPIGVTGTGKSFPPEIYPRLELLELPKKNVPITVRYGEPISYEKYYDKPISKDELSRLTKELMFAISKLIDFSQHYVPVEVPIPPLPRYKKVGVLLLHGFTSSVKTVDGLVPHLKEAGIPYRMPVLRGHGTVYTDLRGVRHEDWYADAETALLDLAKEVDRVVVVGLSMGGLVALQLGIEHPEKIAGVVTLAAALRFKDPLAPLTPVIAKVVKSWPSPNAFNDPSLKHTSDNYPKFMTDAFASLIRYSKEIEKKLWQFTVPIAILQSKKDQIVDPVSANLIYRDTSSKHREIHWFEKSGHEMGQDLEHDAVFAKVMEFVGRFRTAPKAQAKTVSA
jgi:carboxylesterase